MAGSPLLASALAHAWILPFGKPPLIKGNHCLLGLDFYPNILFSSQPATPSMGLLHRINSRHKQHAHQYCKCVVAQCNKHHLAEQTAALLATDQFTEQAAKELESINATLTKILTKTDQQCQPLSTHSWSLAIQMAYLVHQYWSLQFTTKKTEHNLSSALTNITKCLDPELLNMDLEISLLSKLRKAQKQLKKAKREADKLHQNHLDALLNQAVNKQKP